MCDPRITEEEIHPNEPDHEDIMYPPVENFRWRQAGLSTISIENFMLSKSEIETIMAINHFIILHYNEDLKFKLDLLPGEYPEYFKIRHKMIFNQSGGKLFLKKGNLRNIILNLKKKKLLESKTISKLSGGSATFYRFSDLFYLKFINEIVRFQYYDKRLMNQMSKKQLSNKQKTIQKKTDTNTGDHPSDDDPNNKNDISRDHPSDDYPVIHRRTTPSSIGGSR